MRGALLASSAIRCCRVNTNSGFDAPVMFPSNGPLTQASPFLPGVPQVSVPPAPRYYGMLRSPVVLPAALRFLGLAVPVPCACFRLSSLPDAGRRPGALGCGRTEPPFTEWRPLGLSSSWGTLHADALFSDPGRTETPGRYGVPTRPPLVRTARAPASMGFRGSIAGPRRPLSTLRQRELPPINARLASGRRPALPGGLGGPQGPYERFPSCFLTSLPPFPSFLTHSHCRVTPGGCPPGVPTDPYVRISRIRLFSVRITRFGTLSGPPSAAAAEGAAAGR